MLLFGEETWVLTPGMEQALSRFHLRVVQWLIRRKMRMRGDWSWDCPTLAEAMGEAGFEDIRTYVTRRQNTVAQYIATRPIMDLCDWSACRLGVWVSQGWWDQDGLKLEREKERSAPESDGEEAQSKEKRLTKEETTGLE